MKKNDADRQYACLLLGTNQGDRATILAGCRDAIARQIGRIEKASAVYETEAWGREGLPPHLNQALWVSTTLSAHQVLTAALSIEQDFGRIRQEKWGVRSLDIDIIYYNGDIIDDPDLKVPHPLMQQRRFVLVPVAEILPHFVHPVLLKDNATLLREVKDTLAVTKYRDRHIAII